MATFSQSTVAEGSESITDFCCSPCLENKNDQLAEIYCDNCLKLYCAKCINLHGQLFGNHVTYGRGDPSKWPVSKEVEVFLQKCDLHEAKRLKMFCNDHSQLCCTECAFLNHRQCVKVAPISESAKGPLPDLQQVSRRIQTILVELKNLQNYWDNNMQSLEAAYNKQFKEICETREKINTILDEMENTTKKELDDKMTSLKASLKTDMDNGSKLKTELKRFNDAINDIVDKGKAELSFIASKKCMEKIKQSETYLKENSVQVESSLIFQANTDIQQHLSKLSGVGRILLTTRAVPLQSDPDQVFNVQGKSEYNVRIPRYSQKRFFVPIFAIEEICSISAICVLSNDQILVAVKNYKQVRLLNHQYQVVGHCNLNACPNDMCRITPSEVAVAVTNGVQFVSVNDGRLVMITQLEFQHRCNGIAHNLQDLYLTSGKVLYKYSISGDLLNKLYEDTSADKTVYKCAVSPSGDKIFVTNYSQHKVLTLARDGSLLNTFTDPDLKGPLGIHVTALGQVMVCGYASDTILQLDGEGKKKLGTLATRHYGLDDPWSVCFNLNTASIIVGGQAGNKILVLKVK